MENEPKQFTELYTQALETTPEEVRAFLWSDTYKNLLTGIGKYFNLNEVQKNVVENLVFDSIIGVADEEDFEDRFTSIGIPEEKRSSFYAFVYDYLIDHAADIAENAATEASDSSTSGVVSLAPTPSDILTRLNQSFTAPTTLAPVKRDYSVARTEPASNTPSTPVSEKKIDPYREQPEIS